MERRDFLAGSAALAGAGLTTSPARAGGPDVTCGLTLRPMPAQDVPALRVIAVSWDSGFRDTPLRAGDQILAVDGTPIVAAQPSGLQHALGNSDEPQAWAAAGRGADSSVTLTLRRRVVPGAGWQKLTATGHLRPADTTRNDRNDPVFGPGGPPQIFEDDGFDQSWGQWYDEKFTPLIVRTLDDPLLALAQTTRIDLAELQGHAPRITLLESKYPGPFARAVRADYDAALTRLTGEEIHLTAEALAWRSEQDARVQQVRDQARAAWETAIATNGQTMPPFPAIDPTRQNHKPLVGKRLVLPPLRNSDWISDTGRTWFAAGSPDQGFYFLDAESPDVVAALETLGRYRRIVAPNIDESYTYLVEIIDAARLGAVAGGAYFGLQLRLVAALVGEAMFVDVTTAQPGFAGEAALMKPRAAKPADDAPPEAVMRAFVDAVKEGDLSVWKSLFADWWIDRLPDGRPLLYPHAIRIQEERFEEARRLMLGRVWEARPVWVGDPRVLIDGKAYDGALRIEEVDVELRHYGKFDGAYRAFTDVTLSDFWTLQRVNGGPWRIADQQVL